MLERLACYFRLVASGTALLLATAVAAQVPDAAPASSEVAVSSVTVEQKAQSVVHMLDYVGVDYPEFVKDGKVLDEGEYLEQKEFARESAALLSQLPSVPDQQALVARARHLLERIEAKALGTEVSALAAEVRAGVIRAWKLAVAPRAAPDLAKAAQLFAAQCAACHGAQGRGDGPLAKGMEPVPSNFHDEERMKQRSLYGLYNTITLGVGGTPMRAFGELSEADRWALAFFAATLRESPETLAQGEAAWKAGQGQSGMRSLRALVMHSPAEIAAEGPQHDAVRAFLTAQPAALQAAAPAPLEVSRARLADALAAYRAGDREAARQHAVTAYLEGFELVEASLNNVDGPLRVEVEREMMALRTSIADELPADAVTAQVEQIERLLDRVDEKLSGESLTPTTAFLSSLLILLREGLEAILVLAAISAFVLKTGRRDAMPYIHAGWIAAVALGAVTWVVATYVIGISGANRELTEGVTALVAAAMLLYVGWWLHSKSYAHAWSKFIREQITAALGKKTLWAMAGVSFLAVYRELFEIVLFYQALWVQAGENGRTAVVVGIAVAAALLALIGGAILKYSVRLPIGPFFGWTSALLALLAVVFAGSGIKALQEAGVLDATVVRFIEVPLLGIYATAQGLLLQALTAAIVIGGMLANRRRQAAQVA